jgi:hypothetical protein
VPPADAAAPSPTPVPLARAFLALSDPGPTAAPPVGRKRIRSTLAAAAVLAIAAPLSAAGLAVGGDDRAAATLPAKTWLAAADDAAGPDGG